MSITLISAVVFKNWRFELGYEKDLLYRIPKDLQYFKSITFGHTVVMGYNTWLSLNEKPLVGRTNIVLSRKKRKSKSPHVNFMTFEQFCSTSPLHSNEKYFIIGGGEIYKLFLKHKIYKPTKMIITHIEPDISIESDTSLDLDLISEYKITGYSETNYFNNLKYTYIYYSLDTKTHQEIKYNQLMEKILKKGESRIDRTRVGTLSLFGESLRFDISDTIPMMTSRKISFKNIVEELLWFCKGQTDAKILSNSGVHIWNGNSSREFLDSRGLFDNEVGDCGPIYGHQWRRFGQRSDETEGGVDQLKYIENLIKTDPTSRRIMLSSWNPYDSDRMALLPCHTQVQWYVSNGKISCMFNMRSSDFALAGCYNIVSYSILTYILAKRCGYKAGEIIYNVGDCHIYKNHMEAVKLMLSRKFRPFPSLILSEDIKTKDWSEMTYKDFKLIGYFPNQPIIMKMAV